MPGRAALVGTHCPPMHIYGSHVSKLSSTQSNELIHSGSGEMLGDGDMLGDAVTFGD